MSDHALSFQIAFSLIVITVFGYRQFNRWTDAETRNESSDVELLAFAQPRSFTSLWRFLTVASLYCLTLFVLYLVLLVLFRSAPAAGADFLQVTGVTKENAWLVALFVVTGLSPILPVFSNIERAIREVMHAWAVVPTKAQQMADELASPNTIFEIDERFFRDKVLPKLEPDFFRSDFAEGPAVTIAQKWCRLKFLLCKYAPPVLDGPEASALRSPYTTRFHKDLMTLQREVQDFAASNGGLLRTRGGSPAAVALSERIDSMLHRLYVLMCCRAFAAERSLDDVVHYFRRSYGVGVRNIELASFPTDPIFDTLVAVTLSVLAISVLFGAVHSDGRVHPIVWAMNAFATHGAGLLVGWLVFARRRRSQTEAASYGDASYPLSRNLVVTCIVLGFALATIPTWAATLYHLQNMPGNEAATIQQLAYPALVVSWPWAFLGSATAVAVFVHLERTANREAGLRIRAVSASGQALTNLAISLTILAIYTPSGSSARSLQQSLGDPVIQLVLVLTGTIGLVLGFFLPSVVHGHGRDLRGGALRYRPSAEAGPAVLTYGGRQIRGEVQEISVTGCVLRFSDGSRLATGRHGSLSLSDGTAVTAHVVRHVGERPEDTEEKTPSCYALQFAPRRQRDELPKASRQRLIRFLSGPNMTPAG